jgi:hypothetical protein
MHKTISSMRATLLIVLCIWLFAAFIVTLGVSTHRDPSQPTFIVPTPVIIIPSLAHQVLTSHCFYSIGAS